MKAVETLGKRRRERVSLWRDERNETNETHHSYSISQSQQLPDHLPLLSLFTNQSLRNFLSPSFVLDNAEFAFERSFEFGEGGLDSRKGEGKGFG